MSAFKVCPCCRTSFSMEAVLSDPRVELIGMRLSDPEAEWNYYFFNHLAPGCGTTFANGVTEFDELLTETVPPRIRASEESCDGHCARIEDLESCGIDCHWAPYRRLMLRLRGEINPGAEPAGSRAGGTGP